MGNVLLINSPKPAAARQPLRMKSTFTRPVTRRSCGGVSRARWERSRAAAVLPRAGQALLLAIALTNGVGCVGTQRHPDPDMVGTKRVLAMSQPTTQPTPHQLQRLHAAFRRDDGTILLQIHAQPVNEAKLQPCTLEILPPEPPFPANPLARRIEVPTSALRLGWDETAPIGTKLQPIPIGPGLTIPAKEVYVWDALAPTDGHDEEIRLVQRLGTVSQWEILHLRAHPTAAQARFTIYEVRPTMVPVSHRAALALMPFALAEEVLTKVGTPVGNTGAMFILLLGASGR